MMFWRCNFVFISVWVAFFFGANLLRAQTLNLQDFIDQIDQSAIADLDWPAISNLTGLDHRQIGRVLPEIQHRLQGNSVMDLAPLHEMAKSLCRAR